MSDTTGAEQGMRSWRKKDVLILPLKGVGGYYYYYANTNRLKRVTDSIPANTYTSSQDNLIQDIDNQPNNNYCYDAIGNLIKDSAEKITNIKWNVYGKIQEITKNEAGDITTIKYTYDASGNRISQTVIPPSDDPVVTWYVRDAQGNILSTYSAKGDNSDLEDLTLKQSEKLLYGSSRLGLITVDDADVDGGPGSMQYYYGKQWYERGAKQYELTNHLGNVLATISDRKFGVPSGGSSLIDHYEPHIVTAQDYYPFGMMSRVALPNSGKTYKFGFNGQEANNEIKGLGNSYTAQYWEYDSRIGRRWNMDPVGKEWESPYAVFSNNPIARVDPNGDSDTASAFKAGVYQSVMNESQKKMQALEPVIKKYQEGIKTMKSLLNQKVLLDVGVSWNVFSWLPQMGSDAIQGSEVDYMASTIAARLGELQSLIQQYSSAYADYSNAAQSLKLEFQNATHFDIGGVILDRLGGGAKTAGMVGGAMHMNNGAAKGSFALYEIVVDGQTLKYGIADAGRVRKTGQWAGYPERLAQQLSKIGKYAPDLEVTAKIHTVLQTTKAEMILVETEKILAHAKQLGIPLGNAAHIKKYAEALGTGELSAKALQALSKFLKL